MDITSPHTPIPVLKMHSLENIILVIPPQPRDFFWTPEALRSLCDFRTGLGADQVMITDASGKLRIWNGDGSPAGACGNGTRCVIASMNPDVDRTITLQGPQGILRGWKTCQDTVAVQQGPVTVGKIWHPEERKWSPCPETIFVVPLNPEPGKEPPKPSTNSAFFSPSPEGTPPRELGILRALPAHVGNAHALVLGPPPPQLDPQWRAFNEDFPDGVNLSFVWPKTEGFPTQEGALKTEGFPTQEGAPKTEGFPTQEGALKTEGFPTQEGSPKTEGFPTPGQDISPPQSAPYSSFPTDPLAQDFPPDHPSWKGSSFWVKTWERGLGLSQGCGSAGCAVGAVLSHIYGVSSALNLEKENKVSSLSAPPRMPAQGKDLISMKSQGGQGSWAIRAENPMEKDVFSVQNLSHLENPQVKPSENPTEQDMPQRQGPPPSEFSYDLWMPGGRLKVWSCYEGGSQEWIHAAPYRLIAQGWWYPSP